MRKRIVEKWEAQRFIVEKSVPCMSFILQTVATIMTLSLPTMQCSVKISFKNKGEVEDLLYIKAVRINYQ